MTRSIAAPSSPRTRRPQASNRSTGPGSAARSPWGWALAGTVLGACTALVFGLPAQWLAAGLERASSGHVQLVAVRGSVWNGSAQLLLTGGTDSQSAAALPGRLHWRARPTWQGLSADLLADCCTGATPVKLQVRPRWGGAELAIGDSQSRWPAGVLAGLGTPWNTLQLQGQLALKTEGFTAQSVRGRLALGGSANLEALAVSSRLSTLRPMGSYRLVLAGGEVPTLQLSTISGALQLSGNGQWVGQRLRFSGEAQAAPGREPALSNLLNIIGRRSGARSLISLG